MATQTTKVATSTSNAVKTTDPASLLNEANNVLTNFRSYPGMAVYEQDIYTAFIQQYNLTSLTYREVDWYIWTAGKLLKGLLPAPSKNRSSVNVWIAGRKQMPQFPQFKQLFQLV